MTLTSDQWFLCDHNSDGCWLSETRILKLFGMHKSNLEYKVYYGAHLFERHIYYFVMVLKLFLTVNDILYSNLVFKYT